MMIMCAQGDPSAFPSPIDEGAREELDVFMMKEGILGFTRYGPRSLPSVFIR